MAESVQYKIAGSVLRIISEDLLPIQQYLPEFGIFQDFQENSESSVKIYCRQNSENIQSYEEIETDLKPIHKFELGDDMCRLSRENGHYSFVVEKPDGKIILLCEMDLDSLDINMFMERGEVKASHFKFTLWIILAFIGIPNFLAPLHSSVIVLSGRAVLFLGESGTGKSTHTRLWTNFIPDTFLLNDDSPILKVKDNTAYVYGSPWSGKGRCYVNSGYPIAAIVRIRQSRENRIERLSGVGAFCALYPSFPPAFLRDAYFEDHICGFIAEVLKDVPVYSLHCLPEREAAYLVLDTVYKSSTISI